MFHFPTFPPHALCVQARVTPHDWCGVPPFGHPRINARLAAPRGLTQPPTSFIGSWCPGIHRVPLTTWPHKNTAQPGARKDTDRAALQLCKNTENEDARVHCAVLNQQPGNRPPDPAKPQPPTGELRGTRPDRPCRASDPPARRSDADDPLSQDPTACLRTGPAPATPFHAPGLRGDPTPY
jgi:hypothetical protein